MHEKMAIIRNWLILHWWILVAVLCLIIVCIAVFIIVRFRYQKKQNHAMAVKLQNASRGIVAQTNSEQTEMAEDYVNMCGVSDSPVTELRTPDGRVWLVVYKRGQKSEELDVDLTESKIVGRSDLSDIYLDDAKLSRQHFALDFDGKHYFITDLDTKNGTFLNGKRISERTQVQCNDRIRVGALEVFIRW